MGGRVHQLWGLAATNMKVALAEVAPMLKPLGGKLLNIAQGALVGMFELIVSIVVAGFLFTPGPQLVDALGRFLGRVLSLRGKELVQLTGATIRNVSRGVVGIALLQAFLAGAGFWAADIAAPSVLAFLALLLGIVQIGPAILFIPIIVWSWTAMETSKCLDLHRLHDPGRPAGQCPQAGSDGARAVHADASNPGRRHRWHDILWNCRVVLRPHRSLRRVGGGLKCGRLSLWARSIIAAYKFVPNHGSAARGAARLRGFP